MEYIVNKNSQIGTDCHKIHTIECSMKPKTKNSITLHECICPVEAKNRAKEHFDNVSGCKHCCKQISYDI